MCTHTVAVATLLWAGMTPALCQSTAASIRTGAEAAQQVATQTGLCQRPAVVQYVTQIGNRLVNQLGRQPFPYKFAVADMAQPNAFSLPGGFVYASRGIIAVTNSEDELAGILAHEILHVEGKHAGKAEKRSILPGILTIPGNLTGMANRQAAGILQVPVKSTSRLSLAQYGTSQETESDVQGAALAARAGYNPSGWKDCLGRLSRTAAFFTGDLEKFSYFNDHPFIPDRIKRLDKDTSKLVPTLQPAIAKDREDFLRRIEGIVLGRDPAHGILNRNVFLHPDLNLRMELPSDWQPFHTAIAFGATAPTGKGQIVVGLESGFKDPEEAALAHARAIESEIKQKPAQPEKVDINGHNGYLLTYEEGGKKPVTVHLLWVSIDSRLLRMAGAGAAEYRSAMRESFFTLRTLTAAERQEITVVRLSLAPARSGESLEAFSKRTGNVLPDELTAALNDIHTGQNPPAGRILKIGRREAYVGRKP